MAGSQNVFSQGFLKFCQETSLHGWRFLSNGTFKRSQVIFWSIIISISFIGCGFLIAFQCFEFQKATIVFDIESMSIPMEELYFPSVVLCNKNTLKQSFIKSLLSNENLRELTNVDELTNLLIEAYISGSKTEFNMVEEKILNCKYYFCG